MVLSTGTLFFYCTRLFSGVGKTASFLYTNIEYACVSGMSFLCTDTKGDLFQNYAGIAKDYCGCKISVLDLRNPTGSDGDNILQLVNRYMDSYMKNPENLVLKAKDGKYAKITAKAIIYSIGEDSASYGQNAFFYDTSEGLLTSVILLTGNTVLRRNGILNTEKRDYYKNDMRFLVLTSR